MVCFSDIPVPDLGIHMGKFSRFGLAFNKSLLIKRGANPVFYVAGNSLIKDGEHEESRAELFDRFTSASGSFSAGTPMKAAGR